MQPSDSQRRLSGLKAVIVGGCGGIGSEISRRFLAEGAECAILDLDQRAMGALAQEMSAGSDRLVCLPTDIASSTAVRAAAYRLADKWGSIDILINSAGVSGRPLGDGPVDQCLESAWEKVLAVNLTGVFLTCKYFLPLFGPSGGSIVHITSDDALVGPRPPHDTHAYIASKGGLVALTRAMAISYASRHIRVNAIAPGWIATPMTEDLQQDSETWSDIVSRHPLGRPGSPYDVAMAAVYLASPEASFVTGVILPVEGGATAW